MEDFMLSAIVVGLIVGALAKLFMPGRDPGGMIVTIILGIVGSAVAHWVGASMGYYSENQPAGWITSILGAMLVLFIYRLAIGHRPRTV